MRKIGILLILFVFLSLFGIHAFAEGFDFVHIEQYAGDAESVANSIQARITTEEPEKRAIVSFDVRSDGVIALAHDWGKSKRISVYSDNMEFLYGYQFKKDGVIAIAWDDCNLLVYCVRGDFVFTLDNEANIISVKSVPLTNENQEYVNLILYAAQKTVGDKHYSLKNDIGIFNFVNTSFSTLSVSQNGTDTVLYNASNQHFWQMLIIIGGALTFLIIVFAKVYKYNKDNVGSTSSNLGL